MSEQNRRSINNILGMEGFKPLTEEEERHIAGGGAAAKAGRCADHEYRDPVTGLCVKRSNSPTPTTS